MSILHVLEIPWALRMPCLGTEHVIQDLVMSWTFRVYRHFQDLDTVHFSAFGTTRASWVHKDLTSLGTSSFTAVLAVIQSTVLLCVIEYYGNSHFNSFWRLVTVVF